MVEKADTPVALPIETEWDLQTLALDERQNVVGFFSILLAVDKRENPHLYTHNARHRDTQNTERITDEMYDKLLHDYKSKQAELTEQMQAHDNADEHFYVTANMTLRLAKRAKQLFESSQPEEKRQLLSFLLANSTLHEKNLTFTMRSPFNVVFSQTHRTTVRRG